MLVEGVGGWDLFFGDGLQDGIGRAAGVEGHPAGEHLVKRHAERVQVSAVVHLAQCFGLLGRHVIQRPSGNPHPRHHRRAFFLDLGQPEVADLDIPPFREEDVGGLDVSMDDIGLVRHLEGMEALLHDREGLARLHDALTLDQVAERSAAHILHHDKQMGIDVAESIDIDDVRVLEPAEDACFRLEPPQKLLVCRHPGVHDLQRDHPIQRGVEGFVHNTHPPMPQHGLDRIILDGLTYHRTCRPGISCGGAMAKEDSGDAQRYNTRCWQKGGRGINAVDPGVAFPEDNVFHARSESRDERKKMPVGRAQGTRVGEVFLCRRRDIR